MGIAHFTPALFHFLKELKANNSAEWFQANKARFEQEVRGPLLGFIEAFGPPLNGISPELLADPRRSGGSMFRINRDIRFALDKSPYKTNIGAQFRHRSGSRDAHSPAFYLHLEPGGCFAGAGSWHPDPAALQRIRTRIASHPREWNAVRAAGVDVLGESLVRVPQGFPAEHPLAEDLRRKDFYTLAGLTQAQVCSPDFLELFTGQCRAAAPLMKFLARALDLKW
jgi:uncharacterized protein (TIGR02453 family)